MKKIISYIIILCFYTLQLKAQDLTVASYNLKDDLTTWNSRKTLVKNMIEKYQFDVIGLQEAKESMANYLKSEIPRFNSSGTFSPISTGILYNSNRLTIQNNGFFWLSATPDIESIGWNATYKRICNWALFKDNTTGLIFYVFNTHFDHEGIEARKNSTTLVLQKINEIAGNTPTVFMGDLNFSQNDSNYVKLNNSNLLKDSYNLAAINHEKERSTANGFIIDYTKRNRIDHIFLSNTLKVSSHDILLDTYSGELPSDHYPVVARISTKYNELGDLYRQFPENFENATPVKAIYAAGNIVTTTGSWMLNNAILGGSSSNDRPSSGSYAVRLAQNNTTSAYLQMNFDVNEGASKVTIQHSTWEMDKISKWQLEYSKDQGLSWKSIGPVFTTHHPNKQQATILMDISGNVRFRINKFALETGNNGRLSIDDVAIYKRKKSLEEKSNVPLVAWQFTNPTFSGNEISANSTLNNDGVNESVLTRGSELSTSLSGSPISLPGGFAAAANISTSDGSADTTSAITNNLYYQFTVSPKPLHKISLSAIDIKLIANTDGAKVWHWKYSLDGVNYKFLAKPFRFNNDTPTSVATINLSEIQDLQGVSSDKTIHFRLYMNGAISGTGVMGIATSTPLLSGDYALVVSGVSEEALPINKLAAWQFGSPQTEGKEEDKEASVINSAVDVSRLVRGAGLKLTNSSNLSPIALSRAFASVTDIASTSNIADTVTSVANNMYFGFNMNVKPGKKVSLSSLNYKIRISSGGAKVWYWKYSLDSVNFVKVAHPLVITTATNTEGEMHQINLATISNLQNIAPGKTVYFRLYTNGSNTTTGTTSMGRSAISSTDDYVLYLNGTVKDVVNAPKIVAWQFATPQTTGGEDFATASLVQQSITTSDLERGAGLKNTDNNGENDLVVLARTFASFTQIETSSLVTDTSKAVASDMYFKFNINVKPGYKLSLNDLDYKIRISAGGAKVWYWKYSFDNVNFERIALPIILNDATNTEGDVQVPLDLSSIESLQNLPAGTIVYFRLYTNGSNITTGTTSIGRSAASSTNDYPLSLSGIAQEVTLPIQLVSFNAKDEGQYVRLNWQTATESSNSHFEILKKSGVNEFAKIGTVQGSGQSTILRNYNYTDVNPLPGINYYQLKQVDFDGKTELFKTISVTKKLNANNFKVWFSDDQLNVSLYSQTSINSRLVVYDISGKILINKEISLTEGQNNMSIPINFQKGVYVIEIQNIGKEKLIR